MPPDDDWILGYDESGEDPKPIYFGSKGHHDMLTKWLYGQDEYGGGAPFNAPPYETDEGVQGDWWLGVPWQDTPWADYWNRIDPSRSPDPSSPDAPPGDDPLSSYPRIQSSSGGIIYS